MKKFNEALDFIKSCNAILICGKDSSGKTQKIKEFTRELSMDNNVLVLSNHKDIKLSALKPENVECLYKPRDCKYVNLDFLQTNAEYIFVDEVCDNIDEIVNGVKNKHLIFVKTLTDENAKYYVDDFDAVIEIDKGKINIYA